MKTAATNLRLTPRERDGIRAAVQKACGETGAVWRRIVVFGSRTDPNHRGGDIDLLVELEPEKPADTFRLNQRLRMALEDELGEQRIDLVLDDGNADSVFPTLARETGVELWSNTGSPPAGPHQAKWDNLVRYLRKCVTADREGDLVPFGSGRWGTPGLTEESLITSRSSTLVVNREVERMEKRLGPGEVLAYGWPTLVMKSKGGSLGVAPLFFIELEPRVRESSEVTIAEDVPSLNPLLFDDKFIAPDVRGLLDDLVASGIPYEDPTLLKEWVVAFAKIFGIEVHSLDENNLEAAPAKRVGIHNAAILVQVEASFMTKALLEELSTLIGRTDWEDTPAALLLGLPIQRRENVMLSPAASPVLLSGAQEETLARIRGDRLSVVTGPPGTGKTQLVVAAIANAWLDGRSILVSSTNNAAVDLAADRTNERAGFPLIIRTGNRERREAVASLVTSILAEATSRPSDEATTRRALHLAVQVREKVHAQVARLAEVESEMGRAAGVGEALGAHIWGDKSHREKAVSLVGPMSGRAKHLISAWFFGNYRRRKFLLSLGVKPTATVKDVYSWAAGEVIFLKLLQEAQDLRIELSDERAAIARADDDWVNASKDAVKHAATATIKRHRAVVSAIGAARLSGPGLGRAIGSSLKGTRGWGCTALSVKQSFPLEPGILDTVLIDEASQCTLAVALPLAYRAKNLVVVGDQNQLTPIIKVDQEHLRSLAASCGLDPAILGQAGMGYGDGSAFTAFAHVLGSEQVSLLDEHFRCHPAIARWFNSMFYGGQLRVLTDVAALAQGERGLAWIDVLGRAETGFASGAHNPIEAQLIVEAIGVELDRGASIGVVTPFAVQASEIRRMARERYLKEALQSVDFTSGTAHRLQGNERDVVFFSCVIADGIRPGTARWVERERNLLNVAVSRAKARLVVFGHPNVGSLGVPSLAALRIAAIEGPAGTGEASWLIHSEAEGLLLDGLYRAGLSPLLKPLEEGYELDFAVIGARGRLNIEVDGDQHFDNAGRQRRQDLLRDRVLEGLGWRVLRIPTWRCYRDMERVIEEVVVEFGMCK